MNDWIDVEKELPPYDGLFEVTNKPDSPQQQGRLEYDGYGFKYQGIYRPVEYWRHCNPRIKRYGKVEDV